MNDTKGITATRGKMKMMVQHQLKLRLRPRQEAQLNEWLWTLTGVWNWGIRKIELDYQDGIYWSQRRFQNLLAGHGAKLGIPSHVIQGVLINACMADKRFRSGLSCKPNLKGFRNKLSSVPFPNPIKAPAGSRITLLGLGPIGFHKQDIPAGNIKCARIVKRASGWYLCLFIDAEPNAIQATGTGRIGVDPGFKDLLTLSTGEKIAHPRELEATEARVGQAQRGGNHLQVAKARERVANIRKDRNHKLSRRLVAENEFIAFSADNHRGVARRFGKSVASSGHGQLRRMLAYKSTTSGRTYVEVNPNGSTRTCSHCGAVTGPKGLAGLSVRHWTCTGCGSHHDRDINAAVNTLIVGAGSAHEVTV